MNPTEELNNTNDFRWSARVSGRTAARILIRMIGGSQNMRVSDILSTAQTNYFHQLIDFNCNSGSLPSF